MTHCHRLNICFSQKVLTYGLTKCLCILMFFKKCLCLLACVNLGEGNYSKTLKGGKLHRSVVFGWVTSMTNSFPSRLYTVNHIQESTPLPLFPTLRLARHRANSSPICRLWKDSSLPDKLIPTNSHFCLMPSHCFPPPGPLPGNRTQHAPRHQAAGALSHVCDIRTLSCFIVCIC